MNIFDKRQEAIIAREKDLIERLSEFIAEFGTSLSDAEIVRRALLDLEEPFQILVAGESGRERSAFINALVGAGARAHDPGENPGRIALLRHAGEPDERELANGVLEISRPKEFLREISVVDMPFEAFRAQERLSRSFASRSDVILIVVPAGRPFSEAALEYLRWVRGWHKKVVVVAEAGNSPGSQSESIRAALGDSAHEILGTRPLVFVVSSAAADRERDGFAGLEAHVVEALDAESQVRLKLENSLGVVERLNIRYQFGIDERLSLLDGDLKTYEGVETQLEFFVEDVRRDLASRMAYIENIFTRINERGKSWLEENIRLLNATELAQAGKMRERFQREVVGDADARLNRRVQEMAGWMAERNLEQWRSIVGYVKGRQQAEYDESLVSEFDDNFEYDREEFMASVGKTATEAMRNHDQELASEKITLSLRDAVAKAAVAEAGALGLGATAVATTMTVGLSVTFAIGTVLLAAAGLFVIPSRRREAQENFTSRTSALKEKFCGVVRQRFEAELDRSVEMMRQAMSPYMRFIDTEQARMGRGRAALEDINQRVEAIKREMEVPVAQTR